MKEKTPKYVAFAIAALRRASYRWWAMSEAMARARVARGEYECAHCKNVFGRMDIQRDHISPVVPIAGWDSLDGFAKRLFCEPDEIQILCKPCHKLKSKGENSVRRENAKASGASKKFARKRPGGRNRKGDRAA